jgi:serine/threonine protein kinase
LSKPRFFKNFQVAIRNYPKTKKINLLGLENHPQFLFLKNLILSMLNSVPSQRPTAAECLLHLTFISDKLIDFFFTNLNDDMMHLLSLKDTRIQEIEKILFSNRLSVVGLEGNWRKTEHPQTGEILDPYLIA